MKMLMNVDFPHEPFNTLVKEGKVGAVIERILEDLQPENTYFTELDGTRSAVLVINITDSSQIPRYAEPFFLIFNADCRFRIAMTPEDLGASGLDGLGKKWL
ncbi:panthothenate synthetase [Photobacterium sp. SDRW27]|uniref:panthothenate synthetase n=1 Tax=Photobacterium obscurum TaxID=2829490 RepID=UPI002243E069|nr:panthothenate synthetase [Photobacterium obscurum]MCW8330158.1 panthothenate synthetase [Photobacterium obscurum]